MEIEFEIIHGRELEKTVDETDLRYNHFFGILIFKKGKTIITVDMENIPLLDSGILLINIGASLVLESRGEIEATFTENDEKIYFRKEEDKLTISSTFTDEVIKEDFSKYLRAVERFYKRLVYDLLKISPVLPSNDMFINHFVMPYSFIFRAQNTAKRTMNNKKPTKWVEYLDKEAGKKEKQ